VHVTCLIGWAPWISLCLACAGDHSLNIALITPFAPLVVFSLSLSRVIRYKFLKKVPLFAGLSDDAVAKIAGTLEASTTRASPEHATAQLKLLVAHVSLGGRCCLFLGACRLAFGACRLPFACRLRLYCFVQVADYTAGQDVVTQGDPGATFYIIETGSVDVLREDKGVVVSHASVPPLSPLALLPPQAKRTS